MAAIEFVLFTFCIMVTISMLSFPKIDLLALPHSWIWNTSFKNSYSYSYVIHFELSILYSSLLKCIIKYCQLAECCRKGNSLVLKYHSLYALQYQTRDMCKHIHLIWLSPKCGEPCEFIIIKAITWMLDHVHLQHSAMHLKVLYSH